MPGIALTAGSDPSPAVSVTVTGLSAVGVSTVTVWRTYGGLPREAVRGAHRWVGTAGFQVWDYEAPIGVPATYDLDVTGPTIPDTLTATITLVSDKAWLSDPLNPRLCVPVTCGVNHLSTPGFDPNAYPGLTAATLAEVHRKCDTGSVAVLGSRRPVALAGQRMAESDLPVEITTDDDSYAGLLTVLLEEAHPVLLRSLPCMQHLVRGSAHLSIPDVTLRPTTYDLGGWRRWSFTADVVRGPGIALLAPLWTYADVATSYATYAALAATGRTYLALQEDPTP